MTSDFLAIGECMVELAPLAQTGTLQMAFAGDTLNTAWYVRKMRPDWRVDYMTRIGQDAVSDRMLAFIDDAGIGTAHVARDAQRSVGLYLIDLIDGERHFSYWRGESAARQLAQDRMLLDAGMKEAKMIYFSAITLAILEGDGKQILLDALARARAIGHKIVFDTNLRPRLWADIEAMRAGVMAAAAVADVVLPSYDDEAAYFGDTSPHATRDRYLAAGVRTVVIKNSGGKVYWAHNGKMSEVPAPPAVQVIDSTAAGDSFNAGFLTAWQNGDDIDAAIVSGNRVAGKVIAGRGALIDLN
ncbi:sugar kinase [Yoonia sp. MH D7]